jgi:hypothetical protein
MCMSARRRRCVRTACRFPTLRAFGELSDRAPIARPPEDRVIVIADDRPFEVASVLAA